MIKVKNWIFIFQILFFKCFQWYLIQIVRSGIQNVLIFEKKSNFSNFGLFFQFMKNSKNGKIDVFSYGFNQIGFCMKIKNIAKMIVYYAILRHCMVICIFKKLKLEVNYKDDFNAFFSQRILYSRLGSHFNYRTNVSFNVQRVRIRVHPFLKQKGPLLTFTLVLWQNEHSR